MLVSVIIPVKNGERYIREAIDSVLCQSHDDIQVIVLDDHSNDSTPVILAEYQSKNANFIHERPDASGFANVLNHGLRIAMGTLVARLDADDIMMPDRLSTQVAEFNRQKDLSVCATYVQYIDPKGNIRGTSKSEIHSPHELFQAARNDEVVGFHHPSVMFRKKDVLSVGGYRNGMWPVEDIDLWTRMVEAGFQMCILDKPLTKYRIHSGSGSREMEAITKLEWVKARARARRQAKDEPSWEEYSNRRLSYVEKWNYYRRIYGKYFYRRAVQLWIIRCRIMAMSMSAMSFVLMPSHLLKKLKKYA